MATDTEEKIEGRIAQIRRLSDSNGGSDWLQAAMLAQTVLDDTTGARHPLAKVLRDTLTSAANYMMAQQAARAVLVLYDEGSLKSPRLAIAAEIEGDVLDVAQSQVELAETANEPTKKTLHLAIAAFLSGVALEDALRRLCDTHAPDYDATEKSTISKLQSELYRPSQSIEIVSVSDNKQITAWADTRNNADHGNFENLTLVGVTTMVAGVRSFIERYLPD